MDLNPIFLIVSLLLKRLSWFVEGFIAFWDLQLAKCSPVNDTGIWKYFKV